MNRPSSERAEGGAVHGPVSSGWLLVALCAATGAYCLLRMRSGVEEQRHAAGSEALMGFGMAAMAVPAAVFTPPSWAWPGYALVFGAIGVHALWAVRAGPHQVHHLVGAGAMVYMALATAASGGHGRGGSGIPVLTGTLLLYFVLYVLVAGARLVPVAAGTGGGAPAGWGDRPELTRVCRLSMGMAMVAMLPAM